MRKGWVLLIAGLVLVVWLLWSPAERAKVNSRAHAKGASEASAGLEAAPPKQQSVRRVATQRRALLQRRIAELRAEQRAPHAPSAPTSAEHEKSKLASPPLPPEQRPTGSQRDVLDKDYIQGRVREMIPLVAECYESELPQADRPAGDLILHFTIEGEPAVGGIVGESRVVGGSLASHQNLVECVVETMFTLEFEPPAEGGHVEVTYPLKFSSDGDDTAVNEDDDVE